MKVVAAIDSMKGSIGSIEAGTAAKAGIRKVCRADVVIKPVADGGEGTTESMIEGLGGEYREVRVTGPDGKHVTAKYGILPDGETIVMEMAEAAGITLIHPDSLDPWNATSFGVGEMILDAVEKGGRKFIIGIGGSATTDGGAGMLQALGYRFLNAEGRQIAGGIGELDRIVRIDTSLAMPELKECSFRIACDVKNPLCGENGAVYVYGPQKGVRAEERAVLDEKMKHYAETMEKDEYYDEQRDILCRLVEANDSALYIYVAVSPGGGSFEEGDPLYDIMDTDPMVKPPEEEVAYLDVEAGNDVVFISQTEEFGWLCTALVWMYDETGDTYAFMNVDISMNDVMADRMDFLRVVLFAILLAMVAACVILVLLVNRFVVNPINQVARAALQYVSDRRTSEGRSASTGVRRISTGEDGEERSAISKLNIRTGDEIQALSEAIKTMELEINEYIQDLTAVTAEKERIGAELNVATQIQADMLPRIFPAFPERKEIGRASCRERV